MSCQVGHILHVGCAAVLAASGAFHADAQTTGTRGSIRGRVVDRATSLPIRNARLVLLPAGAVASTDSFGAYHFTARDSGTYRLIVRMLPYRPLEVEVVLQPGAELQQNFSLDSAANRAQALAPMSVEAPGERPDYRLADFERRRKTGRGYYLDDEEIRRSSASNLQDLTRGMRGVDLRCGGANGCRIQMLRAPMGCEPEYIVDNQVDNVFGPKTPIRDITALEVYSGPADVPGEYAGRNAGCGVIVIWTRSGPLKPLKP